LSRFDLDKRRIYLALRGNQALVLAWAMSLRGATGSIFLKMRRTIAASCSTGDSLTLLPVRRVAIGQAAGGEASRHEHCDGGQSLFRVWSTRMVVAKLGLAHSFLSAFP